MNVLKVLNTPKSWVLYNLNSLVTRNISLSTAKLKKAEEQEPVPEFTVEDIWEEMQESEMSEEEIAKIRFKARIEENTYKKFILKEPVPIEYEYDFNLGRLQNYYGRFGKDSKLNPGICWPTIKQAREMIEDEKIWEPPLEERIKNIEAKRLAEEQRKKEVEESVDKNMANSDKWVKEYYAKIEAKKAKAAELKAEREKLVEEISEYLGYDIDPRDPRFNEAVEQRNKEKKKAMKVKKQQESYEKMMEKLKKIAESK